MSYFFRIFNISLLLLFFQMDKGYSTPKVNPKTKLQSLEQKLQQEKQASQKLEKETTRLNQDLKKLNQNLQSTKQQSQHVSSCVNSTYEDLAKNRSQCDTLITQLLTYYRSFSNLTTSLKLENEPLRSLNYLTEKNKDTFIQFQAMRQLLIPALLQRINAIEKDLVLLQKEQDHLQDKLLGSSGTHHCTTITHNRILHNLRRKGQLLEKKSQKAIAHKAKVQKLAVSAKNLRDLISRLEAERKKVQPKKATPVIDRTSPIGKSHGTLTLPAKGVTETRFNNRSANAPFNQGFLIHSAANAPILCPFDGKVAYMGQFSSYGDILLIEHEGAYYTLLAGVHSCDCVLGQRLLKGEPVGLTARGRNTDLYVEFRKDGKPINPLSWWGIKE